MKNTRTFIIILSIIFTGIQLAKAQEKGTNEISIGYGVGSSNQIFDAMFDGTLFALSLGNVTYENKTTLGPFYLNYNHAIIDKLMIGGTIAYEKIKEDVHFSNILSGEQTTNIYSLGIEGHYHYISNRSFRMYSGLGLGYTNARGKYGSNSDKDSNNIKTDHHINFQLTAIGLRFGKKLGGYTELGMGYKGVFSLGMNYQF